MTLHPRRDGIRLMPRTALASLLFTAAGRDRDVRLSTGVIPIDGPAAGTRAWVRVGTWQRLEPATNGRGVTHASESSWWLDNDGAAALTVVARNLNAGWSDVTVRRAHRQTEGGVVVIKRRNEPRAPHVTLAPCTRPCAPPTSQTRRPRYLVPGTWGWEHAMRDARRRAIPRRRDQAATDV